MDSRAKVVGIVLIFSVFTIACQTTSPTTWERSPPAGISLEKVRVDFREVVHSRFEEAIALLTVSSVVVLTDTEYLQLAGAPKADARKALLIRTTVKAFNPTGYDFYQGLDGELYIHHGVLSRNDVSRSWPIIIFLDRIPNEVWTDCSSAG